MPLLTSPLASVNKTIQKFSLDCVWVLLRASFGAFFMNSLWSLINTCWHPWSRPHIVWSGSGKQVISFLAWYHQSYGLTHSHEAFAVQKDPCAFPNHITCSPTPLRFLEDIWFSKRTAPTEMKNTLKYLNLDNVIKACRYYCFWMLQETRRIIMTINVLQVALGCNVSLAAMN